MRLGIFARAAAMLATVILTACSDWLIEQPQDFFPLNQFPQTEADLAIALGGIDNWYSGGSNQPYFIRGWPILTEVPSDQTITTQTSGSRYEQDTYTLTASNEWLWRVWQQIYGAIGAANFLIQRIPDRAVDLLPHAPQPLVRRGERVRVLFVPRAAGLCGNGLIGRHFRQDRPAANEVRLVRPAAVPVIDPAQGDREIRFGLRKLIERKKVLRLLD